MPYKPQDHAHKEAQQRNSHQAWCQSGYDDCKPTEVDSTRCGPTSRACSHFSNFVSTPQFMLQQDYKLGLNMLQASQFRQDKKKLKGPSAQQTFILGVLVLQKWRSRDSRTNSTDGSLKSCVESVCSRFRVYMCTYIYIYT